MKFIAKPIFEWLIDGYSLFDNILLNYISMGVIGLIAFLISWNIVGSLYKQDIINGRVSGSVLHWIIRLVVFFIIFSFVSVVLRAIAFIITIPLWIWGGVICLLITAIIILIIRNKTR